MSTSPPSRAASQRRGACRRKQLMAGGSLKTAAAIGSACVHMSEAAAQNMCAAMLSAGPSSCSQTGESAHVRPGIFLNLQRLRYFDKVQQEVKAHVRGSQGMACRASSWHPALSGTCCRNKWLQGQATFLPPWGLQASRWSAQEAGMPGSSYSAHLCRRSPKATIRQCLGPSHGAPP